MRGEAGGGGAIKDGKFSLSRDTGLVPGTYNVAVYASEKGGGADQNRAEVGNLQTSAVAKELIPAKFNTNTELKTEIKKGGGNDLSFTLESK